MNNFARIKKGLADEGIEAVIISSPENRFFATGFPSTAGIALVTADGAWFFVDSRYIEAAGNKIGDAEVQLVDRDATYFDRINAVLEKYNIKSVGFEDASVSYADYKHWEEQINTPVIPAQKLLNKLRASKSRDELEYMIKAERIAEKSFNEILPMISTEITERELAAELMCRFLKNGADDKSFDPIIVSGVRSSMPHGVPTDNRISEGFLTMDFGVKSDGWCSDITRTVCVGRPTDEMRKIYDTVLTAQLKGIEAIKAGVRGCDIDAAARKVIDDAGYGRYFGHSFGHSLGIEIHEAPNASPADETPMPVGAVISAEPGIYIPGSFGVRIEDVVYITEDGCENLNRLPKELICL